ncbi:complement C1q-like protein 2 [Megalobrama amblycephala]|uniref:complement C1q-like protein 2 n=1 Tax=Megalobrama amblycephala TaxID=75352 RepID=UPI002013DFF8|nr:complement C1q-like protein 2 [Megalobrama amblycephala]
MLRERCFSTSLETESTIMLIFITVLMLNMWAVSTDDVLSPNINILEELEKIKSMETIMKSLETEMERLRTENKEISNLTLSQVELRKENRDREIAFSARLTQSSFAYIGPSTTEITLTYRKVFTNIGNAYNPITGIFTAPLKGAYMFRISIHGHGGTPATVSIIKNGEHMVVAHDVQAQDRLNSSNGVVLILEVGDVVYVRLGSGSRIAGGAQNFNTFSGYLLFPLR